MKLNKKNGGQILAESLYNHGINTIFMVPGESYLAAIDGLYDYRNEIKLITCRHESGAANMAEAYGKISRQPGIVFVTRGPGACHASVGVHTAMQDSTPMILFIGQITRKNKGREAFQEVDYEKMFTPPFCKWAYEVKKTEELPKVINKAFQVSLSGRPGPVVISLPEDMLEEKIQYRYQVLNIHQLKNLKIFRILKNIKRL